MPLFNVRWSPWKYAGGGVINGTDEKQVAFLAGRMNDGNADVAGNVMAASVELYTALHELLTVAGRMAVRPADGGGVLPADYGIAKANARAALAKARGESY